MSNGPPVSSQHLPLSHFKILTTAVLHTSEIEIHPISAREIHGTSTETVLNRATDPLQSTLLHVPTKAPLRLCMRTSSAATEKPKPEPTPRSAPNSAYSHQPAIPTAKAPKFPRSRDLVSFSPTTSTQSQHLIDNNNKLIKNNFPSSRQVASSASHVTTCA